VHACCFGFEQITAPWLTRVVVASDRIEASDAPRQAVWSHPACPVERLAPGVPFDAEGFFD
jgi:hypothetical protein